MQPEIGSYVTGKVVTITKFGAFVDLGGVTGMIHISEVAPTYVREIRDYLTEGQEVRVKVVSINPEGKIGLSLKQAAEENRPARREQELSSRGPSEDGRPARKPAPERDFSRPKQRKPAYEPGSFEDMMSRFKTSSDDKLNTLKRRNNTGAAPRPRGRDHRRDD